MKDGGNEILVEGHSPGLEKIYDHLMTILEVVQIQVERLGRGPPVPPIPPVAEQNPTDIERDHSFLSHREPSVTLSTHRTCRV